AHDEVRPTAMRLPPRSFPASRPLLRMDLQSPGQDGKREAQLASRPALSGRHQTAPQTQGHAGQDGAPLANRFSSPGEASREYRLTSGCAAWSHYRLFSALRLPTVAYPACSPSLAPHRPPSGSRSDEKSGLNLCHHHRGFVYYHARFGSDKKSVEVNVRPRAGSAAVCSGCHKPAPGYDHLPERRFEFIPVWGFLVFFLYSMRRVQCRHCGVVVVEEVPWSDGKHQLTKAYMLFLAR